MITIATAACISGIICGGVGAIVGRLTSGAAGLRDELKEAREHLDDECDYNYELAKKAERQARRITSLEAENQSLHAELKYPKALREHNEKRHEEALAARDRETELRNERHAEMAARLVRAG